MLLLTILSLFLRVSGVGRGSSQQVAGTNENSARILVFHHDDESSCEDLTINAAGNAVLSDCGAGPEKQYALSSQERAQMQSWINTYRPVSYDQSEPEGKLTTQLYFIGQGKQTANDADKQQLIMFATGLATKIASMA